MSEDVNAAGSVPTSGSSSGSITPEARFAELVITCNKSRIRIAELEATVASLEHALSEARGRDGPTHPSLVRRTSATLVDQLLKKSELQEISEWNKELVATIDDLRASILQMETDAKVQIIVLGDEVERLRTENASLHCENDALKERVADDVLRQRQTNRVEMAFEKAKIASQVRTAGLRRLESMEAVLMESHDDLYFVQRSDALKLPVRNVTFVFHTVANASFPLVGNEELTMNIYHEMLQSAARKCRGYHVCSVRQMEAFAFHSATAALHFARASHISVTNVAWPPGTAEIPYFAPVIDNGEVLYSGPRMHTCVYTCNPGSEVDPITGRSVYYGEEVRTALLTALQGSPVGEIVANEAWGKLFCTETNIVSDVYAKISTDVQHVRDKLGTGWNVLAVEPSYGDLLYSIIPTSLERRRGLPPYLLHPTPRFPRALIDSEMLLSLAINSMKGVRQLANTESEQQKQRQKEGWVECISDIERSASKENDFTSSDLVELYSLRQKYGNIITLCSKFETICAFHESMIMQSEDAYLARIFYIDPNETSYVCTVDIGESALWREVTRPSMNNDEHRCLRATLRSAVLSAGSKNEGIQVNGNNRDVFAYAFHQTEQALQFVSEVYTFVSDKCAKLGREEICLMRAAITAGKLRPTDSNDDRHAVFKSHHDNDDDAHNPTVSCSSDDSRVLICRGRVLTLSGTLCDLACVGEIFAESEFVHDYYATKSNCTSMEYNIVKRGGRYIYSLFTLIDVYSILPRSYACRQRQKRSLSSNNDTMVAPFVFPRRSAKSELQLVGSTLSREEVAELLLQQQQLMERGEAAMMASHDTAWDLTAQQSLRLPWLVMSNSITTDTNNNPDMGFLFCDAASVPALSSTLPDDLCKDVLAQYNHVVKQALLDHDGFVSRTDSRTAYIVLFKTPQHALEAALQIDRDLLALDWPRRLHTLEPTLRVRSAHTGRLLFAGVRLRAAVGVSRGFDTVGVAGRLGGRARGGEILVTPAAIAAVGATLHGSLLLQQFTACVVDNKNGVGEGPILACVPRGLGERLKLIATQYTAGQNENAGGKVSWWQETSSATGHLPISMLIQKKPQTPATTNPPLVSPAVLQVLDEVVSDLKRELASSIDVAVSREHFLTLSRDVLNGLRNAFWVVEEGRLQLPPQTPTPTDPAAMTTTTTTTTTALTATETTLTYPVEKPNSRHAMNSLSGREGSLLHRTFKGRLTPSAMATTIPRDPYKNALHLLDNAIKNAVQRSGRASSVLNTPLLPKLRSMSKSLPDRGRLGSRKTVQHSVSTRM